MSEEQEPQANPYNAKKEWHTPDGPPMQSVDSLFFEEQQEATSEEKGTVGIHMIMLVWPHLFMLSVLLSFALLH